MRAPLVLWQLLATCSRFSFLFLPVTAATSDCEFSMDVYETLDDCNSIPPLASGLLTVDSTCRTVAGDTADADFGNFNPAALLLPGNYKATCLSTGLVRFEASGCTADSCSALYPDSTECSRDLSTTAALFSRPSVPEYQLTPPNDGGAICTILTDQRRGLQVAFSIRGDCQACLQSLADSGSATPAPTTLTDTTAPPTALSITVPPTFAPTPTPPRKTAVPTRPPVATPTQAPTNAPRTFEPTRTPTRSPTTEPTGAPEAIPTVAPNPAPIVVRDTAEPTAEPRTFSPTRGPTKDTSTVVVATSAPTAGAAYQTVTDTVAVQMSLVLDTENRNDNTNDIELLSAQALEAWETVTLANLLAQDTEKVMDTIRILNVRQELAANGTRRQRRRLQEPTTTTTTTTLQIFFDVQATQTVSSDSNAADTWLQDFVERAFEQLDDYQAELQSSDSAFDGLVQIFVNFRDTAATVPTPAPIAQDTNAPVAQGQVPTSTGSPPVAQTPTATGAPRGGIPGSTSTANNDKNSNTGVLIGGVVAVTIALCLISFWLYQKYVARASPPQQPKELETPTTQAVPATPSDFNTTTVMVDPHGGDEVSTLGASVLMGLQALEDVMDENSTNKNNTSGADVQDEPTASVDYDYQAAYVNKSLSVSASDDEDRSARSLQTGNETASVFSKISSLLGAAFVDDENSFQEQYLLGNREKEPTTDGEDLLNDVGNVFHVTAPAGKLGMVVDKKPDKHNNNRSRQIFVCAMQPDSVLFGTVHVGDVLVAVDGESITDKSAWDVSQLIGRKARNPERILSFVREV